MKEIPENKWVDFPEPFDLLFLRVVIPGSKKSLIISGWWNGNSFEGQKLSRAMTVTHWARNV
jgi:hypothetical protein